MPGRPGRPRKEETDKVVRILMSAPATKTQITSAAGYSNSKLFQFALDLAATLLEHGEILPEFQKGSSADPSELIRTAARAILKDKEAYEIKEAERQAERQETRAQDISQVINHIIRLRFDILAGKTEAKIALKGIIQDAPPETFDYTEVYKFLTVDETGKHLRKQARSKEDIIEHYKHLYNDQGGTPLGLFPLENVYLMAGNE